MNDTNETTKQLFDFHVAMHPLKDGKKVKCSTWTGYWKYENDTIMMYCKDGEVKRINDTEDIFYTLSNVLRSDWEILDDNYDYKAVHTMNFGEALKNLLNGKKVARKGWNGKDQFVYYTDCSRINLDELRNEARAHLRNYYKIDRSTDQVFINGHLDLKNAQDQIVVGWTPTQTDMLANDWYIVQ